MAEERDELEAVGQNASADETAETERLKDEIERTRANMGETIDAIQERLSISRISEQVTEQVGTAVENAKEAVYDATVGKVVTIMKNVGNELSKNSIVRTAKRNPVPFIFLGLGAGMLAYQAYSGNLSLNRGRGKGSGNGAEGDAGETENGLISRASSGLTTVAGSAYEKVTEAVGGVYEGAGRAATAVYERADGLRSVAVDRYDTYIEENPLAVGAVALALGAAIGFAIPTTEYEGELMGSAKQELLEKAQSTATGFIEQAKESISAAAAGGAS